MKLSRRWIEQYTNVTLTNEELVDRIGSQLGAVEGTEDVGAYYSDAIVVAKIAEARSHPDADKLGLYVVEIDTKGTTRQLVAGDTSLAAGDLVAYIPPGSDVPESVKAGEPFTIQERELRGQMSQGMLGSGKELLMNDDHSRVLKLDTDQPVGTSFKQAYQLDDFIVDIENKMFTHRPDLFGILGLARELAGIQGSDFNSPDWYRLDTSDLFEAAINEQLPLAVLNQIPKGCPRFTAVVLDKVTVGPSPLQLQSMLQRVGLRPINNIVDATNYIMYVTAQPSHAFDYDKIKSLSKAEPTLQARMAKKNEKLTLLDGRTVTLDADTMVVATDTQAVSIGGAIGGSDTEVDDTSKRVIIEVANWDLYAIRRTSFKHGIFTDAVTRYNKGQASAQTRVASAQVVEQIRSTCGAVVGSAFYDEYPVPDTSATISLDADFVNVRLGSDLSADAIAAILMRTEIDSVVDGHSITATVPFWRTDLCLPEDLVEEIGRLIGFDNLPVVLPDRATSPSSRSVDLSLKHGLRNILSASGANEVLTYNFVSEKLLRRAGVNAAVLEQTYRLRNSISPELERMRPALLPSILDKVNGNVRQGYGEFALFEINKSHNKVEYDEEHLPKERTSVGFVYCGPDTENGAAYYHAKRYLQRVLSALGVHASFDSALTASNPWQATIVGMLEPKRSAQITSSIGVIGFIGEPSEQVRASFKLPVRSAMFELELDSAALHEPTYQSLSKFPASKQAITLEIPDKMTFAEAEAALISTLRLEDTMVTVRPITVYRADQDASLRRLTFAVSLQSQVRTLTTTEVNQAINTMAEQLKKSSITQI